MYIFLNTFSYLIFLAKSSYISWCTVIDSNNKKPLQHGSNFAGKTLLKNSAGNPIFFEKIYELFFRVWFQYQDSTQVLKKCKINFQMRELDFSMIGGLS
jgi:hypothetical protein